jgi:hypothetical protein
MKTGRAFVAGVIGGAVMSALMWMGRLMGMPANLEMMLGTMATDPGTTAWIIGLVMHLTISGFIGLIYGWAFEHITHRAGWLVGAAFGIVHTIPAGLAMGMMPMMHPRMPTPIMPPGSFMSAMGAMGVLAELMLHLAYGAVVGAVYGPVAHPRLEATNRHAVGA